MVQICAVSLGREHLIYCHQGYPSTSEKSAGIFECSALSGGFYCTLCSIDISEDRA
jgi:hypothetical protein